MNNTKNNFRINLKLIILLFLSSICHVFAFTPQPGSPMALGVHPRLHITPADLPQIRLIIASNYQTEFQQYVDWAATEDVNNKYNNISDAGHDVLRALMVHQAFIASLGIIQNINYPISLQEYANKAISSLLNELQDGEHLSYVAALTYDWTFNFMTLSERTQIANYMLNREITHKVFSHSIANPHISPKQMFSSKYYEGCYAWYIALAFWGDGMIDQDADNAVDSFYDTMLNYGYLDAQNFVAGNNGGWSEWAGYSSWHPRFHMLLIDGWTSATGEDYISQRTLDNGNALTTYPKFITYMIDPHPYYGQQYTFFRMGGASVTDLSFKHAELRMQFFMLPRLMAKASIINEAGVMRYIIENYNVTWLTYEEQYLWGFLGLFKAYQTVSPSLYYQNKYFWSKNIGIFTARTGFNSLSDGVFTITASHFYYSGHDGADDFNGFGLNKFGTILSTRFVRHRGYGNLSDYPGGERNNIVYFEGGHEGSDTEIDDPSDLEEAFLGVGDYDQGGIEQITVKNDYFYHVRVNFNKKFEPGVKHTREFIWLPGSDPQNHSDYLIVYDRTTAPSKPHWIYHVPWRPTVINYSSSQDITTGSGENDRIGDSYSGSEMTVKERNGVGGQQDNDGGTADSTGGADAHGIMFNKILLPKNVRVEVTRVAKFNNAVLSYQEDLAIKSHRWQVDVIPENISTDHRFLNVFQTGDDNKISSMVTTSLVEVGNVMQGAFIENESANRPYSVILFPYENTVYNGVVTYTINGNGSVRHTIIGMKPHTIYEIQDNSSSGTSNFTQATEPNFELWNYRDGTSNFESGVLYFETTLSGNHTFTLTISGQQDLDPPAAPQGLIIK